MEPLQFISSMYFYVWVWLLVYSYSYLKTNSGFRLTEFMPQNSFQLTNGSPLKNSFIITPYPQKEQKTLNISLWLVARTFLAFDSSKSWYFINITSSPHHPPPPCAKKWLIPLYCFLPFGLWVSYLRTAFFPPQILNFYSIKKEIHFVMKQPSCEFSNLLCWEDFPPKFLL